MIEDFIVSIMSLAFGPWDQKYGVGEEGLNEAENRLGVELPGALVDLYQIAGKHEGIMDADYHFTPLSELKVEDGHIVICTENQGLASWAIEVDECLSGNPQVLGKRLKDTKWYGEALKLSGFLLHTVCWQAIVSMPEVARCNVAKREFPAVEEHLEHIAGKGVSSGYRRQSYTGREDAILATYIALPEDLYIGANKEEDLLHFESSTGLNLDWL
jgi:hypothetical protein